MRGLHRGPLEITIAGAPLLEACGAPAAEGFGAAPSGTRPAPGSAPSRSQQTAALCNELGLMEASPSAGGGGGEADSHPRSQPRAAFPCFVMKVLETHTLGFGFII